jgi:hypothetical protein
MKSIFTIIALLFLLSACTAFPKQGPSMPVACTEEAKICPDGSAVGRTGPGCSFAPCPVGGKDYCETDADCICDGTDPQTGDCFVGSKKYYNMFVDSEKDCPDFCTGIAGDRETRCMGAKCMIVRREKPLPVEPSMEIVINPRIGQNPLMVNITAILRNADSNDKRFYCAAQHWSFGDKTEQAVEPSCVPWFPDAVVPTRYSTTHRYERPGSYNVSFNLGTYRAKPATVSVLPELFPTECDEDSDCVKAQCCHAVDCVIKEKAPICRANLCTMDCAPGTLDCGGGCACIAGRCEGKNFQPGKVGSGKPIPWGTI